MGKKGIHWVENEKLLQIKKKRCVICNRTKGLHLFRVQKGSQGDHSPVCKKCYSKTNSYEVNRNQWYKSQYGISLVEYNMLLAEQGGRCFICRKKPGKRRLAVDHDHALEAENQKNGEKNSARLSVRGLLCYTCNRFLGHIGDKIRPVQLMSEYLRRGPRFP